MRYLFLLILLAGCIVEPLDDEPQDVVLIEEEPELPEGNQTDGVFVDHCAPIYKTVYIDGKEVVMEIPVECHPVDLPFMWWDDDYDGVTDPMIQYETPVEQY